MKTLYKTAHQIMCFIIKNFIAVVSFQITRRKYMCNLVCEFEMSIKLIDIDIVKT